MFITSRIKSLVVDFMYVDTDDEFTLILHINIRYLALYNESENHINLLTNFYIKIIREFYVI